MSKWESVCKQLWDYQCQEEPQSVKLKPMLQAHNKIYVCNVDAWLYPNPMWEEYYSLTNLDFMITVVLGVNEA